MDGWMDGCTVAADDGERLSRSSRTSFQLLRTSHFFFFSLLQLKNSEEQKNSSTQHYHEPGGREPTQTAGCERKHTQINIFSDDLQKIFVHTCDIR